MLVTVQRVNNSAECPKSHLTATSSFVKFICAFETDKKNPPRQIKHEFPLSMLSFRALFCVSGLFTINVKTSHFPAEKSGSNASLVLLVKCVTRILCCRSIINRQRPQPRNV